MKRSATLMGSLTIVLALTVVAPAGASVESSVYCGDVITSDVVLSADLDCRGVRGLTVEAPDVTIDLNGYAILGETAAVDSWPGSVGIRVDIMEQPGDVTVLNGTISGFDVSVFSWPNAQLLTKNVDIDSLDAITSGGQLSSSTIRDYVYVRDNGGWTFDGNVFDGASLGFQQAGGNTIVNNVFRGVGSGISLEGRGNHVEGNRISGGNIHVGDVTGGSRIVGNVIEGAGIHLAGILMNDVEVVGNRISQVRGAGILMHGDDYASGTGMVIRDNEVIRAGYDPVSGFADGIHISSDPDRTPDVAIGGNFVVNSGRYAIYAPDAKDTGGNRAPGNPNTVRCIGVTCLP